MLVRSKRNLEDGVEGVRSSRAASDEAQAAGAVVPCAASACEGGGAATEPTLDDGCEAARVRPGSNSHNSSTSGNSVHLRIRRHSVWSSACARAFLMTTLHVLHSHLLHALLLVHAYLVVLLMLAHLFVVLLLVHLVVVVCACMMVARSCTVHTIQVVLVVSCLCRGPPVTAWTYVATVPRGGRVPKVGFWSDRRFASCLRSGGRGKFSAGQLREQVVVQSPLRRPGPGFRRSGGGAVTPSLHPEVPDTQFV